MHDSIAPNGGYVNANFLNSPRGERVPSNKHEDDARNDLNVPCDHSHDMGPRLQQSNELLAEEHRRECDGG